ncbi:hypothetical protein L1280_002784 [Deinococcus sp. HSC-46F16]|uniref:hypothetical protein n=1 Tax=Deinococcus sp. HSC-46F16 TaxID=2910968 RepID=UPI0020A0A7AC|nr:hypothetical protein [Deinococcus sp. HSC-46F16]MCP2015616.1 hypothetical protein [Deinococcus sp. HSC-46F16]
MTEKKTHPLEKFAGATKRITLPMSGIEVVVRRADVDAITNDAMKTTFQTGVLREVAAEWAKEAAEETRPEGSQPRPQPQLSPDQLLVIQAEATRAVLRNTVILPTLDELMELYGGGEQFADLGFGPDYQPLMDAVNELNPTTRDEKGNLTQAGDAQRDQAKSVAAPERGDAAQSGDGV